MKSFKFLFLCFGLIFSVGAYAREDILCVVENPDTGENAKLYHYESPSNGIFDATVVLKKASVIVAVRQINKGKKQKPVYRLSMGEIYDSGSILNLNETRFSLDQNGWAGTFISRLAIVNCNKQK